MSRTNFDAPARRAARVILAAAAAAVLAACAATPAQTESDAALLERAQARWDALLAKDYDAEQRTVKLVSSKTGGTVRIVGLNDDGVRLFERKTKNRKPDDLIFPNTNGTEFTKNAQGYPVRKAYQRAGIEPLSFHDLRTTYGSWLAKAGVPLLNIAKAMGHKDTRITSKYYAHLVEADQHEIIRAALPKLKKTA